MNLLNYNQKEIVSLPQNSLIYFEISQGLY